MHYGHNIRKYSHILKIYRKIFGSINNFNQTIFNGTIICVEILCTVIANVLLSTKTDHIRFLQSKGFTSGYYTRSTAHINSAL